MKQFQQDFFNKPKDIAVAEFKRRVDTFLGPNNVGTKPAIAGLEGYYNANAGEVYPTGFVSIVSDTWDF